jgi:hypothetical protein
VQFRGRFCPISEICQEVANLSNPLPRTILSILYKETRAGDDRLTLARRSLKIFDAILEALTLLLVDIAPMRPPPHSCILKTAFIVCAGQNRPLVIEADLCVGDW